MTAWLEKLCSSKNSDGNKTLEQDVNSLIGLCSSKNSDGNKTVITKVCS